MAEVRPAAPGDSAAIRAVIVDAFGQAYEADLVAELEADGDVLASLVAEAGGEVVGHVLLSRMEAPFRAAALAPLAVRRDRQRRGIGAALVRGAVDAARAAGCDAVFVLGDPAWYGRFGFTAEAAAPFDSPHRGPHFMALVFRPALPAGPVRHADAFGG